VHRARSSTTTRVLALERAQVRGQEVARLGEVELRGRERRGADVRAARDERLDRVGELVLPAQRAGRRRAHGVEDPRREGIQAHALPAHAAVVRLLEHARDRAVGVDLDRVIARHLARVALGAHAEHRVHARPQRARQTRELVPVEEDVTEQAQERALEERLGLCQRVRDAQGLGLLDGRDREVPPAIGGEEALDLDAQMSDHHHGGAHAGTLQRVELPREQRTIEDRQQGLGDVRRELGDAPAAAGGQHDGQGHTGIVRAHGRGNLTGEAGRRTGA
jgi:hypothetical protein